MKGDNRLINIRHKDGRVQRLPRVRADALVDKGRAQFISNTRFKAAEAGVQVLDGMSDTEVKEAIRKAKKPDPKPKETSSEDGQEKDSKKRRRRGSRDR